MRPGSPPPHELVSTAKKLNLVSVDDYLAGELVSTIYETVQFSAESKEDDAE